MRAEPHALAREFLEGHESLARQELGIYLELDLHLLLTRFRREACAALGDDAAVGAVLGDHMERARDVILPADHEVAEPHGVRDALFALVGEQVVAGGLADGLRGHARVAHSLPLVVHVLMDGVDGAPAPELLERHERLSCEVAAGEVEAHLDAPRGAARCEDGVGNNLPAVAVEQLRPLFAPVLYAQGAK